MSSSNSSIVTPRAVGPCGATPASRKRGRGQRKSRGWRKKAKASSVSSNPPSSSDGNESQIIANSFRNWLIESKLRMCSKPGRPVERAESEIVIRMVATFFHDSIKDFSRLDMEGLLQQRAEGQKDFFLESAINRAANLTGRARRRVVRIWNAWENDSDILDGEVLLRIGRNMNRGRFSFKSVPKQMYPIIEEFVAKTIPELDGYGNVANLHLAVKDNWNDLCSLIPLDERLEVFPNEFGISASAFRCLMTKRLNFRYMSVTRSLRRQTEERKRRVRSFICQMSDALRKEAAGTHILCFMDESYCHRHHMKSHTWVHGKEGVDKTSKGERLILIHAMTRHGLLFDAAADRTKARFWDYERDKFSEDLATCDVVFPSGVAAQETDGRRRKSVQKSRGDYHDNMNGSMFMRWIVHRFMPSFRACFGSVIKPILVLDNAPYHHGRGDSFIDVNSISKFASHYFFDKYDVQEIKVTRTAVDGTTTEKTFERLPPSDTIYWPDAVVLEARRRHYKVKILQSLEELTVTSRNDLKVDEGAELVVGSIIKVKYQPTKRFARGGASGPYKDEVNSVLAGLIKQHEPQLLLSELRTYAAEKNIELIFTPPYAPDVQPIELIWALSKRFVGKNWFKERTLRETAEQLYVSWYGGDVKKKGVVVDTVESISLMCGKLVERSLKRINDRIKNDEYLSGTVQDLDRSKLPLSEQRAICDVVDVSIDGDGLDDVEEDEVLEIDF